MTDHDVLNVQYATALEHRRPFYMVRPKLFIDGKQWCALYGENLQDGVVGFGDTPDDASYAFDKAWYSKLPARSGQEAQDCGVTSC